MNFQSDITSILISIPIAIISVVIHELVKSVAAFKLGDTSIKEAGRLTLNPKKHVDPLGAIFLVIFGYGWSNPVKITPFAYRERKKALLIIFGIPFIVSLLIGIAFLSGLTMWNQVLIRNVLENAENAKFYLSVFNAIFHGATINIGLALTSLIPVYPFNGAFLLNGLSPMTGAKLLRHERIFQTIVALLVIFGIFHVIINPVVIRFLTILQ